MSTTLIVNKSWVLREQLTEEQEEFKEMAIAKREAKGFAGVASEALTTGAPLVTVKTSTGTVVPVTGEKLAGVLLALNFIFGLDGTSLSFEGAAAKPAKGGKSEDSDAEDSDEKPAPKGKAGKPVVAAKKAAEDSDDEDSDEKPAPKGKKAAAKEDSDDEDSDEKPAPKAAAKGKAKVEDSDDEDSDEKPAKAAPKKASKKEESSS